MWISNHRYGPLTYILFSLPSPKRTLIKKYPLRLLDRGQFLNFNNHRITVLYIPWRVTVPLCLDCYLFMPLWPFTNFVWDSHSVHLKVSLINTKSWVKLCWSLSPFIRCLCFRIFPQCGIKINPPPN